MSFYGSCNCGCGGRHSIDNVSGRPIYVEDYVIPVFKGSTLIAEFQFPFSITNLDVAVISEAYPILEDATVSGVDSNTVSIRWESSVIDTFDVGTNPTFRVSVFNSQTNETKNYNLITIRPF